MGERRSGDWTERLDGRKPSSSLVAVVTIGPRRIERRAPCAV